MELVFLLFAGGLAVIASLLVIFARSTLHSALWMVLSFFMVAVIYVLLRAEFLAMLQIIVYAGAIMMFIIYAIMMLNIRQEREAKINARVIKIVGIGSLVILFLELLLVGLGRGLTAMQGPITDQLVASCGRVAVLSNFLFSDYLLPFEVASILLTAGVVGAVVLSKRAK
ncbi:MAG: NADH-quinone oxidoreductase subunit J [Deltaproteobacteria bacterium]|nr:NADH-quinone oxidoreductase subunit J [Deltaproteobacteria bacterium]